MKRKATIFLILLVGLVFVSCSSGDEKVNVIAPVFPESKQFDIIPDEIIEINFNASTEWKLASNRQWLKFIDNKGRFQSLTGKPGEYTVKITVTDGALGFVDDEAIVELTMGELTQTVAELTRSAKKRVAKMFTMENGEIKEIDEFVDETFARSELIGFEANFDWRVDPESIPEWLINTGGGLKIQNLSGEAGQVVDFSRMVYIDTKEEARYSDLESTVTIRAINSDYTYRFPIKATGIEAGSIKWIGSAAILRGGLLWDDKGNTLKKVAGTSDIYPSDEPNICHVIVRDNKFTLRFMEWDSSNRKVVEVPEGKVWVDVVRREGGLLTLKAKDNLVRSQRKMVVFFVPENTEIDYSSYFNKTGVFNFLNTGYGMQLEQYGLSGGFGISRQKSSTSFNSLGEGVEVEDVTEIAERLSLTKLDNIYEHSFTAEEWNMKTGMDRLHVAPLGLITPWNSFDVYNSDFVRLGVTAPGWSSKNFVRGNVYDENYNPTPSVYIDARIPFKDIRESCLYIVFRDSAGKDMGTFVIRKSSN